MSAHTYHDALPGYSRSQIWHDGCEECEYRGGLPFELQLGYLDNERFARATQRARALGVADDLAKCELTLLRSLKAVIDRMDRPHA